MENLLVTNTTGDIEIPKTLSTPNPQIWSTQGGIGLAMNCVYCKKVSSNVSVACWPTVGRQLADRLPTAEYGSHSSLLLANVMLGVEGGWGESRNTCSPFMLLNLKQMPACHLASAQT